MSKSKWVSTVEMKDNLLENHEMEIIGRLVDASNATLLCSLPGDQKVIYKPIQGERPLWDFTDGNLASREVAAFYISELGKFHLVPETILRDGPFGLGAVQIWIETDQELDVVEKAQSFDTQIRQMALFDAVINNADRKFGHVLISQDGKIFGCDHGVSFHVEDKLRTVIWQFADQELVAEEVEQLRNLAASIDDSKLENYLTALEVGALRGRIEKLLTEKRFPLPNPNWPAIPWPPY